MGQETGILLLLFSCVPGKSQDNRDGDGQSTAGGSNGGALWSGGCAWAVHKQGHCIVNFWKQEVRLK